MHTNTKNIKKIVSALSLLLLFSISMLNVPVIYGNKSNTTSTPLVAVNNKASNTSVPMMDNSSDIQIRNVTVSDRIVIENNSKVLFKDIGLEGGVKIEIKGNAYVSMINVNASDVSIKVRDNAALRLFNLQCSSVSISVYDDAKLIIENSFIGNPSSTTYINDYGTMIINNSYILKGSLDIINAQLNISGSIFNNSAIYFFEVSQFYIEDSSNFSYIQINDNTQGNLKNVEADKIYIYNKADIRADNLTANMISIYADASIYMKNSHIYRVMMPAPSGFLETLYFGGHAEIVSSTVEYLSAYSGGMALISNSNIGSLYYVKLYTGDIIYNSSGVYASNVYDSYMQSGSTINSTIENTNMHVFMHSSNTTITYSISYASFYLFDCDATLEGLSSPFYLYAFNSTITSDNSSIEHYLGYNSEIMIIDSDLDANSVSVSGGKISINDSRLDSSSIYMTYTTVLFKNVYVNSSSYVSIMGTTMHAENLIMNNTSPFRMYSSHVWVKDSVFSNTNLYLYGTYLQSQNTTFYYLYSDNVILNGAVFSIEGGFIHLQSGTITCGIEDVGQSNADSLRIDSIYIYGGRGNISGNISAGSGLNINIDGAEVNIENFTSQYGNTYISVSGVSKLTVKNSKTIWSIHASNTTLNVSDMELNELQLYYSRADLTNVNVSIIEAYNVTLNIEGSNISEKLDVEFEFGWFDQLLLISHSDIKIVNSYVKEMFTFSFGTIYIDSSQIETLVYTFSDVTLKDSNVDFALNNYLVDSGSVEIYHNSLNSGTWHNLLHIVGSTSISNMQDAVVVDFRNDPSGSIQIENSSYAGVVILGGNAILYYSNFSVVIANCTKNLVVMHSIINDTMFGDVYDVFAASGLSVTNSRIGSQGLMVAYANSYFYNTVFDMNEIDVLFATRFDLSTVSGHVNTIFLQDVSEATISLSATIEAINSTASLYNTYYSSVIAVNSSLYMQYIEASSLFIDNISRITMVGSNISMYEYSGFYAGANIDSYAERTNISTDYLLQISLNIPDIYTVAPDNLNESYLQTIYNNSYLSTAIPNIHICITGHVFAKIENFTGNDSIDTLFISAEPDTTPPKVNALNDTLVYEEGLDAYVVFTIDDEIPNNYTLRINNTIVDQGTYSRNAVISVNLKTLLSGAATYMVILEASDAIGNIASNFTKVIAHTAEPPQITEHPNATYTIRPNASINLTWVATDISPNNYSIFKNGTSIRTSSWISGQKVSYIFVSTKVGLYNITIIFEDLLNLKTKFVVMVNVTQAAGQGTPTTSPTTTGGGAASLGLYIIAAVVVVAVIIGIALIMKKKKE